MYLVQKYNFSLLISILYSIFFYKDIFNSIQWFIDITMLAYGQNEIK